ncbi:MAG: DUF5916 domain-containing protein [Gemmatimonadota bacterium]
MKTFGVRTIKGVLGPAICAAAMTLFSSGEARSQGSQDFPELDPALPVIRAHRITEQIHLDGQLDEEAWRRAAPATVFTQLDPWEGEPATEDTEVYILFDDQALYVGAVLRDGNGVSTRLGRRDGFLMDSDWLTISLDSYNDHRSGFKFEVNPSGVRGDEALSGGQDRRGDSSWDPVWEAATAIHEWGWSAEIRIPFSQLRFRNTDDQVWGIQITRDIARNREKQLFSFTPKEEAGGIARYGHLVGIRDLHQSRRLEILPYVQGRAEIVDVDFDEDAGFKDPYRDGSDFFYGMGLDLKYGLSSNLTLNATVTPDFGQVEVDPAVVNLTAFETRFDEKRPFFVEGASIFSFGGSGGHGGGGGGMFGGGGGGGGGTQLLYSRRIGGTPRGDVPDEAVYEDGPDQTTILSAAKLTGRTAGGWSLGIMEAVTGEETANFITEDRIRGEAAVAPLANYLVGRVRKDFRSGQTTVGAIGTAVNRDLSDEALSSELRASAYSGGLDFFHEWGNRTWSLSGHLAGSRIMGEASVIENAQTSSARYFQRPDAGHVTLDPSATSLTGYTGEISFRRQAGLHWRGRAELKATSPGFEVNDLGFQRDADRREAEFSLEYQENRPGDLLRNWEISASPRASWNFDGDRVGTTLSFRSRLTFLNYWSLNPSYTRDFESYDDRLTWGGPLARKPAEDRLSLWVSSDFSKPYNGMISVSHQWDAAGGEQTSLRGRISLRPTSAFDLSLGPNLTLNRAAAQYIGSREDPLATHTYGERYIFGELEQTTLSLETRLNVTFTPNLTLELFAQPFMASGDYGTLKELRAPGTFEFNRYGIDAGTIQADEEGDYLVDPDGTGPAEPFSVSNRDFNRVSLRGTGVIRWEWRPGSTLFLVWQQSRSHHYEDGNFDFRRDSDAMWGARADNVFMVKATYWIGS